MCSIRIFAKNMGDPHYEPTIVVHDNGDDDNNNNKAIEIQLTRYLVPWYGLCNFFCRERYPRRQDFSN